MEMKWFLVAPGIRAQKMVQSPHAEFNYPEKRILNKEISLQCIGRLTVTILFLKGHKASKSSILAFNVSHGNPLDIMVV